MLEYILVLGFVFTCIILSITYFKAHPFIVLLLGGLLCGALLKMPFNQLLDITFGGFADTVQWIGIIMILGTVVGEVLNRTGGAQKIANLIVRITGINKLPAAMGATGYIIAIPVFVDVAYIVLQPITEVLSTKKGSILSVGLSLTAGLTAAHALLPPTPGPLAIAAILEADLGRLIMINAVVALFALTGGILWAVYFCHRKIDYDKELVRRFLNAPKPNKESHQESSISSLLYLLPILVPLVLIGLASFYNPSSELEGIWVIGNPVIALMIGVVFAYLVGFYSKKPFKENLWSDAITKSAEIIMITAAGGAFGNVIKQSGFDEALMEYSAYFNAYGLLIPFLLAAILTTATGSITVSMITSASVIAPMSDLIPLSTEMIAALIGSGAFCCFHVNSSFFWLLHRLHKVPVKILLRTFTLQSLVMGIAGLLGVLFLYLLGIH